MAVAAEADWIIDLGPEAGAHGGQIIAEGTPEQVAKSKRSLTAKFLEKELGGLSIEDRTLSPCRSRKRKV
jgi:excinuclease ABC subunit A